MGNLKHYIKGISNGDSFFTLSKKLSIIVTVLAVFHAFLAIIFCILEVYPMMIYSALSVAIFAGLCMRHIRNGKIASLVFIGASEIILCSMLATVCIGNNCGFSSYNISLMTALFYLTFVVDYFKEKEYSPFFMCLVCIVSFFLNMIISKFVRPLYTMQDNWVLVFYIINNLISFLMIIAFNYLFIWEIKANQTALANQNKQLDVMANHDPLTHLLNRRCMDTRLEECMQNLRLKGVRFSLILCDIDDFKKVNDTYGHDAGDAVLVWVSDLIKQSLRDGDEVCRWGGEEILIKINGTGEIAYKAAERIRKKIDQNKVSFEGKDIHITMTFGISESIPGYNITQLVQQADDKLYQGKHQGKNVVIF
ncbi:MAG: GGDEF domain-containing protein [Lachnospiraceae bacterium]